MNRDESDLSGARPLGQTDDASVVGLLRQLSREVPALFTKELALAKAELHNSLSTLKAGIAAVAGGAIVGEADSLPGFAVDTQTDGYFLSGGVEYYAGDRTMIGF